MELNSLLLKFFCYITCLLYYLIRRDIRRLTNEVFTSNPIVSSKQLLSGLKITDCSMYFGSPQLGHTIKTNCIDVQAINPEKLNSDFLEKSLGLVSPPRFVYNFSRKNISKCHILQTDQISLSDCLSFVRYWAIYILKLFVSQFVTAQTLK